MNKDKLGGEGGIRTLGTVRFTAFRERPVQPLLHLSRFSIVTDGDSRFHGTSKDTTNPVRADYVPPWLKTQQTKK